MNRRALLKTIGGSATFGLAGCITQQSSMSPEQSNDTASDAEDTDTATDTNDGDGPTLQDRSFTVVSAECGTGKNESSASFETNSVRVSGSIPGSDSCHTAELKHVACEQDTLTVSVAAYKQESDTPCSMCVTDVEYDATFNFESDLPHRIVVLHDEEEVLNESQE